MKNKILTLVIMLPLLIVTIISAAKIFASYNFEKEMKNIAFNQVRLFMSQSEVEKLYGLGKDLTPGCFGCELNFIYPDIYLSGRYSDTYDRMKGVNIDHNKSPKIKRMETANQSNKIFNIRVGDTFEKAEQILRAKGFQKINSGTFIKKKYTIEIFDDAEVNKSNTAKHETDDGIIKSMAVSYDVEKDNLIQY